MKYCGKCGQVKSVTEFSKNKTKADGLQSNCKECKRGHYQSNRGQILEQQQEYRAANPEQRAKSCRLWREAHREDIAEYSRSWNAANPMARRLNYGRQRARAAGLPADVFSWDELTAYWESQGIDTTRDAYTGEPLGDDWELDHTVPLCDPASPGHVMSNLRKVNRATNMDKGKLTAEEFMAQLEPVG